MKLAVQRTTVTIVCTALALAVSTSLAAAAPAQISACGIVPADYNLIESDALVILGTPGDDFICAGPSANTIRSGAGDDIIHAMAGDDKVFSGDGADTVFGEQGADRIRGGEGNDTIDGGSGDDLLIGQGGNDSIRGFTGDDIIRGRRGNDVLWGGRGADNIRGNRGHDVISGGAGDDDLSGNRGADRVSGGPGDDIVRGGADDDTLDGGQGDDHLVGGSGTDTLTGGQGQDTVNGGLGNDVCSLFGIQNNCESIDSALVPMAPNAFDDAAGTNEDTPIEVDVLSNDSDANGDTLVLVDAVTSGSGTITFDAVSGTISYDPAGVLDHLTPDDTILETVSYTISDGALTDSGTLTIHVSGVNDHPRSVTTKITSNGTEVVELNVLSDDIDVDGDSLAIFGTLNRGPGYPGGGLVLEPAGTDAGTIRWDPTDSANGGANAYTPLDGDVIVVIYTLVDGYGGSDIGALEIHIEF